MKVKFKSGQYKDGEITVSMTHEFFIENIRHKLNHGQRCIQEIEVVSPSGAGRTFTIIGEHAAGIRYRNGKINLNLVRINYK